MRFWLTALLLGGVAYCISQGANARGIAVKATTSFAQMPVQGSAEPPVGYIVFCANYPDDCLPRSSGAAEVRLSGRKWRELKAVNKGVNESIKPMSDMDQYHEIERWTFPLSGKGDCEDYVLLKQRRLTELGWPMSTLLITVVRDENGEGHAVLTVRTNKGDFVLDNKNSHVRRWKQTPYIYIKRQSAVDPRRWDSLLPAKHGPAVAAAGTDARK